MPRLPISRRDAATVLLAVVASPAGVLAAPRAPEVPLQAAAIDRVDRFLARQSLAMSPAEGDRAVASIDAFVTKALQDPRHRKLHVPRSPGYWAASAIDARPDAARLTHHLLAWQLMQPGTAPEWAPQATDIVLSGGAVTEPEAWLRAWMQAPGDELVGRAKRVLGRTPRRRVRAAIAHERAFLQREERAVPDALDQLERVVSAGPWPPH